MWQGRRSCAQLLSLPGPRTSYSRHSSSSSTFKLECHSGSPSCLFHFLISSYQLLVTRADCLHVLFLWLQRASIVSYLSGRPASSSPPSGLSIALIAERDYKLHKTAPHRSNSISGRERSLSDSEFLHYTSGFRKRPWRDSHATLAARTPLVRGPYFRAANLTLKLLFTIFALAAVSIVILSNSVPIVFHKETITFQISIPLASIPISNEPAAAAQPSTESAPSTPSPTTLTPPPAATNSTKYFRKFQPTSLLRAVNLTACPDEPGNTDLTGHYDARFYPGAPVSYEERTETLRHMVRAYLEIFHSLHVETWIAHGTLLGWWWNEEILPWDWDLDAQVSGQTLAYLEEFLNQTKHTYTHGDIQREYLLDVNEHYTERTRGDGENIIDARWIDMKNGLFIDITGISETNPAEQPDIWSCKNDHHYRKSDIWPLRESRFEGVRALVPHAYDKVLVEEYEEKALKVLEYEGHRWDPSVEKWVPMPAPAPESEHRAVS